MPPRNRNGHANIVEDVDISRHDPAYVIYKIGIYGWRKRCLYFLILLILIIAIINLALTIWIMRVQDFGLNGMGKMDITKSGLRMDGRADFMNKVKAKYIVTRPDFGVKINSYQNISLSAIDKDSKVMGQITLTKDQVILKNKQLLIQDNSGRTLLFADKDKLKLDMDNMDITVPGGLRFENSVQTSRVQAGDFQNLQLESLTKQLFITGASGVSIVSNGNDIKFLSLKDTTLTSIGGQIVLDGSKIRFSNVRQSTVSGSAQVYPEAREVCMCKDGTLFLAPADVSNPCKVVSGVCL